MSRAEALLLSAIINAGSTKLAVREGIDPTDFSTYRTEYEWLLSQKKVPSRAVFMVRYPDFRFRKVDPEDLPLLVSSIRETSTKTKLAKVIESSAKELKDANPVVLAEKIRSQVHSIIEKSGSGGVTEIFKDGNRFVKEFSQKQKALKKGRIAGISTGYPTIDKMTGGFLNDQMYIIIGRQGQSKTYQMLWFASLAALEGKRILWISREMPEDMVTYRVHTIMSNRIRGHDNAFSNLGLILGREDVNIDDYRSFVSKMRKEVPGRFFIPEARNISVSQVGQYVERYKPDVIFYDYIGIIGSGDSDRSWQKLGAEANIAKEIAMTYHVPFILASQVNRGGKDQGEAPMVENIAFADSIGYAADLVLSLQQKRLEEDYDGKKFVEIWVRKSRYGADDFNILVEFDPDKGLMREISSPAMMLNSIEVNGVLPEKKGRGNGKNKSLIIKDRKLDALLDLAEAMDPEQKRARRSDGSKIWTPTRKITLRKN